MKIMGIYSIENITNNYIYIGCSNDITRRWQEHIDKLLLDKHENINLQKDFNRLNKDVTKFKFEVLETVQNRELLWDKELIYMKKFDKKLYNKIKSSNNRILRGYKRTEKEKELIIRLLDLIRLIKYPIAHIDIDNPDLYKKLNCEQEDLKDALNSMSVNDFKVNGAYVTLENDSLLVIDYNRAKEISELLSNNPAFYYAYDYSEIELVDMCE